MQLNAELYEAIDSKQPQTLVLIHGLFGSLSNLGMLARAFQQHYRIVQVDLRNHGKSAHVATMSYLDMAQDVLDTLNELNIEKFSLIGHSMGGKVAMKMTEIAADRIDKLVVLDMSPVAYQQNHHDQIFEALFAVQADQPSSRKEATEIMKKTISEEGVIMFLLKSWNQNQGWLFNLNVLKQFYPTILGWESIPTWSKPTLFIKGGNSFYISKSEHYNAIAQQFSHADIKCIENAGHWLHAEKTEEVIHTINTFLNSAFDD